MVARPKKSQQIRGRDRRGAIVSHGVVVERVDVEHPAVEDDVNAAVMVVHDRERGHRARLDAEGLSQQLGTSKGETFPGTELPT